MDLIVGATDLLGTESCRLLTAQGAAGAGARPEHVRRGKGCRAGGHGAAIVIGDLKDPASLDEACHGATSVCSTASSKLSRQAGDSIETVDRVGQLALIDAAGRHELSDNAWRIQGFGALGWDITPWLTFSPSFEYNESVAEEGSAQPLNFLETFFPFTIILPHKWAVTAGYENKTDFENDNYVTNRAKIAIAKELESIPLSFYLQAKRDFDSGEKEFQVNFVVSCYFR
jgi:hypothetical protein